MVQGRGIPREQANGGIAAGGGGVMRRGNQMAGVGPGEVMRDVGILLVFILVLHRRFDKSPKRLVFFSLFCV